MFLVTNLSWQTDLHLAFKCLCIIIDIKASVKLREGTVCPFIPNVLRQLAVPMAFVWGQLCAAGSFISQIPVQELRWNKTWHGRDSWTLTTPGWELQPYPSTEVPCFYLTLGIIYILKELKDHRLGFWRYEFSCKLHTVWVADSHVVVDNWILRSADRPAHHYCRYNWSPHSFTMPLSPKLTVCWWHTMHV